MTIEVEVGQHIQVVIVVMVVGVEGTTLPQEPIVSPARPFPSLQFFGRMAGKGLVYCINMLRSYVQNWT